VIRQYDHEVQGGSVVKPLVGARNDGPSDAAVLRPVLGSPRGVVVACGMNPRYGDFDTYHMAASAIDEAVRNCVAVGADPRRIAILDNFCWGDCDRPETLGSLVRAAVACHDVAVALGTPFISGKDSLNNELSYVDAHGQRQTIVIPPSLLISALGQMADVRRAVTMDLKAPGNLLYQVGVTHDELGGSHYALVQCLSGGRVPRVDPPTARQLFLAVHGAIESGLVRACHDLSEGGLAAALAEMALAGDLGAEVTLEHVPRSTDDAARGGGEPLTEVTLFSESNSRLLVEVSPECRERFEAALDGVPHGLLGRVTSDGRVRIRPRAGEQPMVDAEVQELRRAWQRTLDW
jgi:phosphoribosylformylglycinamidine synthase